MSNTPTLVSSTDDITNCVFVADIAKDSSLAKNFFTTNKLRGVYINLCSGNKMLMTSFQPAKHLMPRNLPLNLLSRNVSLHTNYNKFSATGVSN